MVDCYLQTLFSYAEDTDPRNMPRSLQKSLREFSSKAVEDPNAKLTLNKWDEVWCEDNMAENEYSESFQECYTENLENRDM